ncbi:hypothetical protein IT575_06465 [bacterium]|nr:hypothetical protein [bacterium]
MTHEDRVIIQSNLENLVREPRPGLSAFTPLLMIYVYGHMIQTQRSHLEFDVWFAMLLLVITVFAITWMKHNNIGHKGREELIVRLRELNVKELLVKNSDPADEVVSKVPIYLRWMVYQNNSRERRFRSIVFLWPLLISGKDIRSVLIPMCFTSSMWILSIAGFIGLAFIGKQSENLVLSICFGFLLLGFASLLPNAIRLEVLTSYLIRELAGTEADIPATEAAEPDSSFQNQPT